MRQELTAKHCFLQYHYEYSHYEITVYKAGCEVLSMNPPSPIKVEKDKTTEVKVVMKVLIWAEKNIDGNIKLIDTGSQQELS